MLTNGSWTRTGSTITLEVVGDRAAMDQELAFEAHPSLKRGSRGSAVSDLQRRLAALGFSPGAIDGIFGSGTESAVRAFQQSRRLTVDGIVGPNTWSALASGATPPVSAPPVPAGGNAGKIGLDRVLKAMQRKGYVVYTEPSRLNIVGIRNPTSVPNSFDDSINVFYKDDRGSWVFRSFPATVDPGMYYLLQPMNVSGAAIVVPGQYIDSHQLGLHRSSYTALVQRGPMTVARDDDRDTQLDFGASRATGVFGINIHRSSASGTSKTVDRWSAGCQVFASSSDFSEFIALCQKHSSLYGNRFTYTLVPEEDIVP